MALFSELTAEQQAILQHYVDVLIRPVMGELARVNNHLAAVNTDYNAQSSAILSLLDTGAVIPNGSGLAGTATLDKEDVITLTSYAQGVLTNYNTAGHRENFVKAAGAENTIG
ncbi:MAG: hypothetical protein ACYS30_24015 [Planctomycetota bacterium]|jgi:hypothetical protein